jgi:hypothetical protein
MRIFHAAITFSNTAYNSGFSCRFLATFALNLKNHHNFARQALQSTEVTILNSEEYCYEKYQPNADFRLAGTTKTLRRNERRYDRGTLRER